MVGVAGGAAGRGSPAAPAPRRPRRCLTCGRSRPGPLSPRGRGPAPPKRTHTKDTERFPAFPRPKPLLLGGWKRRCSHAVTQQPSLFAVLEIGPV